MLLVKNLKKKNIYFLLLKTLTILTNVVMTIVTLITDPEREVA